MPNRAVGFGGEYSVDLGQVFAMAAVADQVVRFDTRFQDSDGNAIFVELALFEQRAPNTVQNFRNYVGDGDYDNSFMHRSIPGFIIQGGGFFVGQNDQGENTIQEVPEDPPVANEPGISNTPLTVAMAKLQDQPDSATSGWFINLGDNSANLDNQNGGFTVFARVTPSTESIAATFGNPNRFPPRQSLGFDELPLRAEADPDAPKLDDLIIFPRVEMSPLDPADASASADFTCEVVSNSNPSLVKAEVDSNNRLQIERRGRGPGNAEIVVRATDSAGHTVDDRVTVELPRGYAADFVEGADGRFLALEVALASEKARDIVVERSADLGRTDPWQAIDTTETDRTAGGRVDTVTLRSTAAQPTDGAFYRVSAPLSSAQ